MLVGNKFPPLPRKDKRVSRENSQKKNNSLSADEFLIKLTQHLNDNFSDVLKFSRVSLLAMNKFNRKSSFSSSRSLNDASNSICCQWCSMTVDIVKSRIFQLPICKTNWRCLPIGNLIVAYSLNNPIRSKIFDIIGAARLASPCL